ncbi:degV family protein [Listeria grayi FSL F6-1183]|uniref:DegV family protein n=1 Tax=Listeria grayi FSL F6-1183 TaxID=1265827 RepID=A0A829R590_LISGR|nr:degV family protein [Listeria grayi FSL F6-1183]
MAKIKIITDSTAEITQAEAEQYNIDVLPLTVEIDGTTYVPGEDIESESFMEKMEHAEKLPKSSQPAIGKFVELYEKYVQEGYQIISIHLTEKLSGTVATARQASEIVGGDITVIDSDYIARGLAFQVIEAAKLAKTETVSAIEQRLAEIRAKTSLYIVVVSLDNLIKGGRVGKMKGLLGNLLQIKLIAKLSNGELAEEAKVRSNKKIITYLVDKIKEEKRKRSLHWISSMQMVGSWQKVSKQVPKNGSIT